MDALTIVDATVTTMDVDAIAGFGLLSCFSSATITMAATATAIAITDADAETAFSAEMTVAAGLSGFS